MKKEIVDFFLRNTEDLEFLIEDTKIVLNSNNPNDSRSFILVNIFYEIVKSSQTNVFLSELKSSNFSENIINIISNYLNDEKENILNAVDNRFKSKDQTPILVDLEWKLVGMTSLEKAEIKEYSYKILLKLIFGDGSEKIVETNFANLKKLQEELEESISFLNSAYARRIETFSK